MQKNILINLVNILLYVNQSTICLFHSLVFEK